MSDESAAPSAYAAPRADLAVEDAAARLPAPRWHRALAAALDWGIFFALGAIGFVLDQPQMVVDSSWEAVVPEQQATNPGDTFALLAAGFLLLNFVTLGVAGRSAGLVLTRLQLVDRQGRTPKFLRAALPRWGLPVALLCVDIFAKSIVDGPLFFGLFLVANAACCFFGSRRSLVDRVTGTDAVIVRRERRSESP